MKKERGPGPERERVTVEGEEREIPRQKTIQKRQMTPTRISP